MTFLPKDYNVPKSPSRYYVLEQGDNLFRILSDKIVMGWEDWEDNKPIRTPFAQERPEPINPERAVKHFWAFPVWDYRDKKVKIYSPTQATIQNPIVNLYNDGDWGSPTNYDLNVIKTGEGKSGTKYSVIAKPPKPLDIAIKEEWEATDIDLQKLFTGDDPFSGDDSIPTVEDEEDIIGEPDES